MINIYANGVDLFSVDMTIEQMDAIMNDSIIQGGYFIPFEFANGKRGAIMKREIRAYTENMEDVEC